MPAKLVVIGQGYVGLPIAIRAVEVGYHVIGAEVDQSRVDSLVAGRSYVEDISDSQLQAALATGRYLPSVTETDLTDFDYAIITVPTPLKEGLPDLSFIETASGSVAKYLKKGATVVLESTTYPGTTEELMVPILERGSGLKAVDDFHVGYSPERIDPGNPIHGFVNTPKVVAGLGAAAQAHIVDLYANLVDTVIPVSGPKEAELTKLLENTFRHVNIALVNELAIFARELGVDIWEAIDAAATKPFGFMKFTPGPGVGGHCLPVDPSYLSWQVRRSLGHNFRFVELANDVNQHMPDYVVQRVMAGLNERKRALNGSQVLLLGLSYKKNVGDDRESPALRVAELLLLHGADVIAVDPYLERCRVDGVSMVNLSRETLDGSDAIVLLTDHDSFDYELIASTDAYLLDTKNRLPGHDLERL